MRPTPYTPNYKPMNNLPFSPFYFATILAIVLSLPIQAQTNNDPNYFRHCIGVKQSFSSWGECSNSKPNFESATITATIEGSGTNVVTIPNKDNLYKTFCLVSDLIGTNEARGVTTLKNVSDKTLSEIKVSTKVGNIKNDTRLEYSINVSSLVLGALPVAKEASDPCHNMINFSNREGYTMTTTVIVDHPVYLKQTSKQSYNLETESLDITTEPFYVNDKGRPKLQINVNNEGWQDLDVDLLPGKLHQLSYTRIAGAKNSDTNYFKWMGKTMYFRAKKTLLDGKTSYGNPTGPVVFYPQGPQFTILDITRSYCDTSVTVTVKLDDLADKDYWDLDTAYYSWKVRKQTATQLGSAYYYCQMQHVKDNIYTVRPYDPSPTNSPVDDPFGYGDSQNAEWVLQLEDTKNKGRFACSRSFVIPGKPGPIAVAQSSPLYPADNPIYHLATNNNPYAVINFKDNSDIPHLRLPYKIYRNETLLATINQAPQGYNDLTQEEKNLADARFEAAFNSDYTKRNGLWGKFLDKKYKAWYEEVKDGELFEGTVPTMSWLYQYSAGLSINTIYLFSPDSHSFYYGILNDYNEDIVKLSFVYIDAPPSGISGNEVSYQNMDSPNERIYIADNNNLKCYTLYNGAIPKIPASSAPVLKIIKEGDYATTRTVITPNMGRYVVHCGSDNKFIVHNESDTRNPYSIEILNIGPPHVGQTTSITSDGKLPFLSRDARLCLYTKSNNVGLYLHNNRMLLESSFALNSSTNISNKTISAILYIDNENTYCLFRANDGKVYKRPFTIPTANDIFNNPSDAQHIAWKAEFRAHYRSLWLNENFGYKLYNVKIDQEDLLTLRDAQECSHPFAVHVKVAPEPDFIIVTDSLKAPTGDCIADGEVVLQYTGGGLPPYTYGAQSVNSIGDRITVNSLKKGPNQIELDCVNGGYIFTYSLVIDAIAGLTTTVKNQTTTPQNGEITVGLATTPSAPVTFKLINQSVNDTLVNTAQTQNHTFKELSAGVYKAVVTIADNCELESNSLEIHNRVFSLSCNAKHATQLQGNGELSLTAINRNGTISFSENALPGINQMGSDATTIALEPGIYQFTASITDEYSRTVNCPVSVTVERPAFSAKTKLSSNKGANSFTAELNTIHQMSNVSLELKRGAQTIGSNGNANTLAQGDYSLILHYNGFSEPIYSFSLPLTNGQAFTPSVAQSLTGNCPGDPSQLTVTATGGLAGAARTYSADGTAFASSNVFSTTSDNLQYEICDELTALSAPYTGSAITHVTSLTERFTTPVTQPQPVRAEQIIPRDASCHGKNDGSVRLGQVNGGSGKYLYQVRRYSNDTGFENVTAWADTTATAQPLLPGTYGIYLKDGWHNCPEVELRNNVVITEPDPLAIINKQVTHPTCGNENGILSANITGGNNLYTFQWVVGADTIANISTPESTPDMSVDSLAAGTYRLTVTDIYQCQATEEMTLNTYQNPLVTGTNVTHVRCHGEQNGSVAIASVTGSNAVHWAVLKQGTITKDSVANWRDTFNGLLAGNYQLVLYDSLGCMSNLPYNVNMTQPLLPLALAIDSVYPAIYKGTREGAIAATVTGGNSGFKALSLTGNQEGWTQQGKDHVPALFDNLKAGVYQLNATDAKGCEVTINDIQVAEPDKPLSFIVTHRQNALCKSQTGSFTVQASGGWGGYLYKRASDNGYYPFASFDRLYAGKYTVSVRDVLGAVYTDTVHIHEPSDSLRVQSTWFALPTCADNGQLTVEVEGGTAPYRLAFANHADTVRLTAPQSHSFMQLGTSHYVLQALDANGCRFNLETPMDDSALLAIDKFETVYPTATNTTDGSIEAKVSGGRMPLSFAWRLNQQPAPHQTAKIATAGAGVYQLTVTDALGCSANASHYLPGEADSLLQLAAMGHETAYLAQNGFARYLNPNGNIAQVQIVYPDGTMQTFSATSHAHGISIAGNELSVANLTGGTYWVLVNNHQGHTSYARLLIQGYAKMQAVATAQHVTRFGARDGQIRVDLLGGAKPYNFSWSGIDQTVVPWNNTDTDQSTTITALPPGTYNLTVTDRYQNQLICTATVNQPPGELALTVARQAHQSCKHAQDAYVQVTATGGWGDYQFRHDESPAFANSDWWKDLTVRTHRFFVIDRAGTQTSLDVAVTEPDSLRARVAQTDSVRCFDASDGNVHFAIAGGTTPYRYTLLDSPVRWVTDSVARNLSAGSYRFAITDSHGCVGYDTLTVEVEQPAPLQISEHNLTHTTCNTDNGSITVAVKGGARPYAYRWSNAQGNTVGSDSLVANLVRNGRYLLEVTDKYSCRQTYSQTINTSTVPSVTQVAATPVRCFGDNTGTAAVTEVVAATPFAPYSFRWSNDSTGTQASGFYRGQHWVKVTDTNGCSSAKYFVVTEPDPLWVAVKAFKDAHCHGYTDGFVEVMPLGGVGGYRYRWSNGDTLALASNLGKGNYELSLTDANGCNYMQTFEVSQPDAVKVDLGDDIRICPGNSITLDGQDFAAHRWANASGSISTQRFVTVGLEDDYLLEVANAIGCLGHDTIRLTIGNDALTADFLMPSEAPLGDTLMVYELSNLPIDSLKWEYTPDVFTNVTTKGAPEYVLELLTLQRGIYNVGMWAYSGGCSSKAVKQVEITDADQDGDDGFVGYTEPLISSITLAPNPNDGNFTLTVLLRETHDIQVVVYSVDLGLALDTRRSAPLQRHDLGYQLGRLNTGVYVVMVTAGNERRQAKMVVK